VPFEPTPPPSPAVEALVIVSVEPLPAPLSVIRTVVDFSIRLLAVRLAVTDGFDEIIETVVEGEQLNPFPKYPALQKQTTVSTELFGAQDD
jgi:hypothetical protein